MSRWRPGSMWPPELLRYFRKLAETALLVLFMIVVSWAFLRTLPYTMPFVIGLVTAVLLQPIVSLLERWRVPRTAAILTAMVVILGVISLGLVYVVVQIAQEVAVLSGQLPQIYASVRDWISYQFQYGREIVPPSMSAEMEAMLQHFTQLGSTEVSRLLDYVLSWLHGLTGLPEWITVLVLAIISTYFFLRDRERIVRGLVSVFPPSWDLKLTAVFRDVAHAMTGMVRAQLILTLITMLMSIIGLLVFRVEYAITIGTLIGLTGLVPIVGSLIVTIPWAGWCLITGQYTLGLEILALQGVISLVRHIIEPKILADNMGLDTFSALIAVYVGWKILGVLGLFVGPVLWVGIVSLVQAQIFRDFIPHSPTGPPGGDGKGAGPPGSVPPEPGPSPFGASGEGRPASRGAGRSSERTDDEAGV
ncbi:MAG: sporulation integral membrane protein YtvI [Kyrpidia tusciae]|nr:sporulation integral membrane protein YtvI [Kyrpidia tusciae]MBE3551920.1 sporulation integral membrane protein YtvI [Kyrpidia tusciae]